MMGVMVVRTARTAMIVWTGITFGIGITIETGTTIGIVISIGTVVTIVVLIIIETVMTSYDCSCSYDLELL